MKIIPGGGQMSLIRDTEQVIEFLDFAGRKCILNEHAVTCRLTACNNLFAVLNEDEDSLDYILGNLDVLIHRFRNRNENVRASTLKAYKSRVKHSIEDFKAWSADPFAWERAVTDRAKAQGLKNREEKRAQKQAKAQPTPVDIPAAPAAKEKAPGKAPSSQARESVAIMAAAHAGGRRVSFPIRPDFSVEMELPSDGITFRELQRLGLFLYPYCSDLDPTSLRWPGVTKAE